MSATLLELWQRTVCAAPGAPALFDAHAGRTWTRAEIAALGASWHARHGAEAQGGLVVFGEPNGPEWLRVFLGLLGCGATVAALDPGEPAAARRAVAEQIGADFLWLDGALQPTGRRRTAGRAAFRLIKLTSGSTGAPRALRFTDAQLVADGRQVCSSMDIRPGDVNLGCVPFGHSYGLGNVVVPLLAQGTVIVSGGVVLPHVLAEVIAEWKPTVFPAVPALLRILAEAEIPRARLGSLRTVISAGAPLTPEIAQAFHGRFGLKVHNFYGSSETGGIAYDRTGEAGWTGRSVGTPLDGVQLRFGAGGRFSVASPAVAGRGIFRAADRGELNAAGELVLLGRAGRMIKIAGRRIDPAEIEQALRELPGVNDAFVAPHPERADALAAVVASREFGPALREALRAKIAAWKIPKKMLVVPEFPLTARGKTDTRRLRELLARG